MTLESSRLGFKSTQYHLCDSKVVLYLRRTFISLSVKQRYCLVHHFVVKIKRENKMQSTGRVSDAQ